MVAQHTKTATGKFKRRALKPLLGAVMGLTMLAGGQALAQDNTVRVLVGYPAGAGTDTLARIYADALTQQLGVNTIVENRPGAGGLLAAQALKRATPESNMVMMTIDHQVLMLPLILKDPGFDVRNDFAPIARVMTFNTCLAVPGQSPAKNLKQFVELAKKDKAQANYGVPAPGSQAHFVGYVVGQQNKVDLQAIPYKGAAPAITDLIGNQVPSIVVPCDALTEHVKAGSIRVLAIAADQRSPLLPDVPTFAEEGVKMPTDNFVGVYASSQMQPEMKNKLIEATRKMFQMPDVVAKFNATGMRANYGTPEELTNIWERDTKFWAKQVQDSNFQVQ